MTNKRNRKKSKKQFSTREVFLSAKEYVVDLDGDSAVLATRPGLGRIKTFLPQRGWWLLTRVQVCDEDHPRGMGVLLTFVNRNSVGRKYGPKKAKGGAAASDPPLAGEGVNTVPADLAVAAQTEAASARPSSAGIRDRIQRDIAGL